MKKWIPQWFWIEFEAISERHKREIGELIRKMARDEEEMARDEEALK